MSDTPTVDVNASSEGAGAEAAKAPTRPVAEIRADMERERAGLERSFAALRGDLDEAVDAGKQRARPGASQGGRGRAGGRHGARRGPLPAQPQARPALDKWSGRSAA